MYQHPTPPPRKSRKPLFYSLAFVGVAGTMLVCSGVITALMTSDPADEPVVSTPPAATAAAPAPAPAKGRPAGIGAGTWEVGTEIKAGTYTTTATGPCYWARLSGFDGELDSVIANGLLSKGKRGRVTIKSSDVGVEFTGGCSWTRK